MRVTESDIDNNTMQLLGASIDANRISALQEIFPLIDGNKGITQALLSPQIDGNKTYLLQYLEGWTDGNSWQNNRKDSL